MNSNIIEVAFEESPEVEIFAINRTPPARAKAGSLWRRLLG